MDNGGQGRTHRLELVASLPSSRTVQGCPLGEEISGAGEQLCSQAFVVAQVGWGQRRGQESLIDLFEATIHSGAQAMS
jgi:hypothetical protein